MGVRIILEQCPKTQEETKDMAPIPYVIVVGSLMYVMVCTRLDIAHVVGVLSKYMSIPGKEHMNKCQKSIQVFVWKKGLFYMLPRESWKLQ
jgi:hypothetical protein